jgi:hypothetical protein
MNGIIERKPRSRGVTQLMYVGDDDAVEKATAPSGEAALGIVAAVVAFKSKGTTRWLAAGIASYIALRHMAV